MKSLRPTMSTIMHSGHSTRYVIGTAGEQPALKAIADLVTPRTRLIVLSHVLWTTGALVNVSEICSMGREYGIPVLVDGAQSAGAIPVDVKALGADYYAIPM